MKSPVLAVIAVAATLSLGLTESARSDVPTGDLAWMQRAEALEKTLARPDRIEDPIGHYREALA